MRGYFLITTALTWGIVCYVVSCVFVYDAAVPINQSKLLIFNLSDEGSVVMVATKLFNEICVYLCNVCVWVFMCVFIYYIIHNRAIRPCLS